MNCRIPSIIVGSIAIIGVYSCLIAAPPLLIVPDATPEENRDIQRASAQLDKPETAKALLEDVLTSHPQNRPARTMLARLFLLEGKSKKAQDAVEPLTEGATTYQPALLLAVEIAQSTGDRKLEIDTYRRLVSERPKSHQLLALQAEAEGRRKQAEDLFKRIVDQSDTNQKPHAMYQLGQFYVRQQQYDVAAQTFKGAMEIFEKTDDTGWTAQARLQYALALWANGDREAARTMVAAAFRHIGQLGMLPESRAQIIASMRILSPNSREMSTMHHGMLDENPFSMDAVVRVFAGQRELKDQIRVVVAALKEAPRLEWALWSALYLGLSQPGESTDLLRLLPDGTIQKKIAEVETKARAETIPTHGKGD